MMNQVATILRWMVFHIRRNQGQGGPRIVNNDVVYTRWDSQANQPANVLAGTITEDTFTTDHEIITQVGNFPNYEDFRTFARALWTSVVERRACTAANLALPSVANVRQGNNLEYQFAVLNDVDTGRILVNAQVSQKYTEWRNTLVALRALLRPNTPLATGLSQIESRALLAYLNDVSEISNDRVLGVLAETRLIHALIMTSPYRLPGRVAIVGEEPRVENSWRGQTLGRFVAENVNQRNPPRRATRNGADATLGVYNLKGVTGIAIFEMLEAQGISTIGDTTHSRIITRGISLIREFAMLMSDACSANTMIARVGQFTGMPNFLPADIDIWEFIKKVGSDSYKIINLDNVRAMLVKNGINLRRLAAPGQGIVRRVEAIGNAPVANTESYAIMNFNDVQWQRMLDIAWDFFTNNPEIFGYTQEIIVSPMAQVAGVVLPPNRTVWGDRKPFVGGNNWTIQNMADGEGRKITIVQPQNNLHDGDMSLRVFSGLNQEAKEALYAATMGVDRCHLLNHYPIRYRLVDSAVQEYDQADVGKMGVSFVPFWNINVTTPFYGRRIPSASRHTNYGVPNQKPPFGILQLLTANPVGRSIYVAGGVYSYPETVSLRFYSIYGTIMIEGSVSGPP
jgi:hypothetical protein